MIYLALDQALRTTGYAIFKDEKLLEWGNFTVNSTVPIEQRLGTFWTHLNEFSGRYKIDKVFLEDIQKQTNTETYKKLCYVQAAIYLWCYFNSIPCSTLGPSHWRKIIKENYKINFGTKREQQKKAAQQFVEQQFNLDISEDEADAVCIGIAGIQENKRNRSAF